MRKTIWSATAIISIILIGILWWVASKPTEYSFGSFIEQRLPLSPTGWGLINPTTSNKELLCGGKWTTKEIRPPVSYTNKLKIQQIKQFGYQDTDPTHYEEDHAIPLTLGGNPTNPKNLWPQPYNDLGAKQKDIVENYLHKQVCNGTMSLQQAQDEIINNWPAIYKQLKNKLGAVLDETDEDDI